MFKKIEQEKKKFDEKIEVYNSSFLEGAVTEEKLVKNTCDKQEN